VGYGHGGQVLAVKAFEASKALEQGANQIAFVLNGGALVSGEDEMVYNDMLAVVDMAHSALAAAAVIVEAESLPGDLVRKACRLAERAGVEQVATSNGGATAKHAIALTSVLRDSVGPRVQVTAAGRFRDANGALAAAAAGATRIATTFSASLIEGIADGLSAGPALAGTGRT